MRRTKGSKFARGSKPQKASLSSDCRLQLACMKLESLVIAGQHTAVNVFLSLVHTARQATKVGGPEVAELTAREAGAEGQLDDWD
jgi:hypothetical protein